MLKKLTKETTQKRWCLTLSDGERKQIIIVSAPTEGLARELAINHTHFDSEAVIIMDCRLTPWWLQNRPMVSSSVDYKATLNMAIADANALGAYELLGLNKQRSVFIASPQDFEALEHGITMLIDRNRNLETALRDCVVSMQNFPLYDLPVAQSFFEQIATELNGTATLAQATLGVSL